MSRTTENKNVKHGYSAYVKGTCRCDEICRPAWNRYQRQYKRDHRKARRGGWFANKKAAGVHIELSDIGFKRLELVEAQTGQDASDIFEAYLRKPDAMQLQFQTSDASC